MTSIEFLSIITSLWYLVWVVEGRRFGTSFLIAVGCWVSLVGALLRSYLQ